jgi:heme-degrading monooxygenase HmoA
MFARQVTLKLKSGSAANLPRVIENDVLPLLRKQKGFRDELTFINPERSVAIGISLWDSKADADAYNRSGFAEVTKALSKVIEGSPTVETFEVANSTFHKVAAKTA